MLRARGDGAGVAGAAARPAPAAEAPDDREPPTSPSSAWPAASPARATSDELWRNLADGVESITFSDAELLRRRRRPRPRCDDPDYVRARRRCSTASSCSTRAFFGYHRRARRQLIDPQQRMFLECAWEALEQRRLRPAAATPAAIGVFAGAGSNTLPAHNLCAQPELPRSRLGALQAAARQRQGLPAPRACRYKLDLRGPERHACRPPARPRWSPSHLACQSLLNGECDMALAGGVVGHAAAARAATSTRRAAILSPDGHCRAFDADARGHGRRQRRRHRRAQAAGRRARRRRHDPRGDQGLGDQQRRRGEGRLHRAERRRPGRRRSPRRSPSPASTPTRSATSRRTAPARRSATRSRSRR